MSKKMCKFIRTFNSPSPDSIHHMSTISPVFPSRPSQKSGPGMVQWNPPSELVGVTGETLQLPQAKALMQKYTEHHVTHSSRLGFSLSSTLGHPSSLSLLHARITSLLVDFFSSGTNSGGYWLLTPEMLPPMLVQGWTLWLCEGEEPSKIRMEVGGCWMNVRGSHTGRKTKQTQSTGCEWQCVCDGKYV